MIDVAHPGKIVPQVVQTWNIIFDLALTITYSDFKRFS